MSVAFSFDSQIARMLHIFIEAEIIYNTSTKSMI